MTQTGQKKRVHHHLLRLWQFLAERLWEEDLKRYRGFRGFLYRQLRIIFVVIRSLPRGQIPLRAAAMTLVSLLTLIPGIVLVFTLLSAFGGVEQFRTELQRFILEKLVTGVQEQARIFLEQYFQGARAFQGISFLFLFGGVLGLLATIEDAFNQIWGIKRGRSLLQRLTTYTTIAVLGPFLVSLSLTMTMSLQNAQLLVRLQGWAPVGGAVSFLYGLLPVLVNILILTILYMVMPNTKVGFLSAFPSAVIAGVFWEVSKWGYGLYLSSATMYRTLYGPLVAVPLLFLWIQLSWTIVLFGALLTFAQEAADDFRLEEAMVTASFRERLKASLRCMVAVCRAHYRGEPTPTVSDLSAQLHIPVRLGRTAVSDLLAGGLLREVVRDQDRGEGGLVPARDLHNLSVYDVYACLHSAGTSTSGGPGDADVQEVESVLSQIDRSLEHLGRPMTLLQIVESLEAGGVSGPVRATVELIKNR